MSSSVEVIRLPEPPSNLSLSAVTSLTGTFTLSWLEGEGTVATHYIVQKRRKPHGGIFGSWTETQTNAESQTFNELQDGIWEFAVKACNSSGCSARSIAPSSVSVLRIPGTVGFSSGPTSTVTSSHYTLAWTGATGNLIEYELSSRSKPRGGGSYSNWQLVTSTTQTSYQVSASTEGHFNYRIRACNSSGCSQYAEYTGEIVIVIAPTTPNTPTLSSQDGPSGNVRVSWPSSNGIVSDGNAQGFYEIERFHDGVATESALVAASQLEKDYAGLGQGEHRFRVRACDHDTYYAQNVCSSYSDQSAPFEVGAVPTSPADINIPSDDDDGSYTLSWTSVEDEVAHYELGARYRTDSTAAYGAWNYENVGNVLTHSITDAADGQWLYAIKACNSYGCSAARVATAPVTVERTLDAPAILTASTLSVEGDASYTLNWSAVSGSAITYYLEEAAYEPNPAYESWLVVYQGGNRQFSQSAQPAGEWRYRVRACAAAVCSDYTYLAGRVEVLKEPAAPTQVAIPSTSPSGSYTLSWQHMGSANFHYAESPDFDTWVQVGTDTSVTFENKPDGQWSYRVRACNSIGCSSHVTSNTVTVNHTTPTAVATVNVPAEVESHTVVVQWSASSSNDVDYYQLSQRLEQGTWSTWQDVQGLSQSSSVAQEGTWFHRIRACNELPDGGAKCSNATVSSGTLVNFGDAWAAQGGTVADAASGYVDGTSHDASVGAIAGHGSVEGGVANYRVAIEVPPGRRGVQPELSLNYSSRGGEGIAGFGWHLAGAGAISRCAATMAQDGYRRTVRMDSQDRLCLNGQKLMLISGSYGQTGATYRTELDNFTKVEQYGALSNAYFVAQTKENQTLYFGNTTDAKHRLATQNGIHTWALSREQDDFGNAIHYSYGEFGAGEFLLSAIQYTGFEDLPGDRSVIFTYENALTEQTYWLAGGFRSNTQRLKQIQTEVSGQPVRNYALDYVASDFANRSILQEVTVCSVQNCLRPTTLQTHRPSLAWQNESLALNVAESAPIQSRQRIKRIDLNGDGLPEQIVLNPIFSAGEFAGFGVRIYRNTPAGYTVTYDGASHPTDIANGIYYYQTGDFNNDGITDFLIPQAGGLAVYQFNGALDAVIQVGSKITGSEGILSAGVVASNTLKVADMNGDGWHDLIYADANNIVHYIENTGAKNVAFNTPEPIITLNESTINSGTQREQFALQDVDGDGILDLLLTWQKTSKLLELRVGFGGVDTQGAYFVGQSKSAAAMGLPANHFNHQYTFADLNGDGLQDYVFPIDDNGIFAWFVHLNRGDRSYDVEEFLATGEGLHLKTGRDLEGDAMVRLQAKYGGLRTGDIDSDGQDELLVATQSNDTVCVDFRGVREGMTTHTELQICDDDLHEEKVYVDTEGYVGNFNHDWARYDMRRFQWSIIDPQGLNTAARIFSNVVEAPIGGLTTQSGAAYSALKLHDIDNNGYLDFTYVNSSGFSHVTSANEVFPVAGQLYSQVNLNVTRSGSSNTTSDGYIERLNTVGYGNHEGKLVDTLESATDGLGNRHSWQYHPLSAKLGDRVDQPFYSVPSELSERYIAEDTNNDYFYFTSSMYVVSEASQSNGIGGENHYRYSYAEAIYNSAGRGFQGFREITVEDFTRQTRSISEFSQLFPMAGRVEHVRVCKLEVSLYACRNGSVAPLSSSDYVYEVGPTDDEGLYWSYPSFVEHKKFDSNSQGTLLERRTTTIAPNDVDKFGNILKSTEIFFDGFQSVEKITERTYSNSAYSWWINKLTREEITTRTLSRENSVGSELQAESVDEQVTTKNYTYSRSWFGSSGRQPERVETRGSNAAVYSYRSTDYSQYGLPQRIQDSASYASTREQLFSYSNDGYFVTSIHNGLGHSTTQTVDAVHGKPTQITDANGVIETFTYDGFGQKTSSTRQGNPTRYQGLQWCYGGCPTSRANFYRFTHQEGTPSQRVYLDSLGREVATATDGFNARTRYTQQSYDARGQLIRETLPGFNSSGGSATTYTYDRLGRMTQKTMPASSGSIVVTYTHNGHETTINASHGAQLSMSRTLASDGKLMQTVDSMGGVTRYAYDSRGNTVTIEDVQQNITYASYDGLGNKLFVDDPNLGRINYTYTGFGEIKTLAKANGESINYHYDALGRVTREVSSTEGSATFTYDTQPNGIGLPSQQSRAGHEVVFHYDTYGREVGKTITIDGDVYQVATEYDSRLGRVKARMLASGIKLAYAYDSRGYLLHLRNAQSGFSYQDVESHDALGNITLQRYNSGTLTASASYSASGQMQSIVASSALAGAVHELNYSYGDFDNLSQQQVVYAYGMKQSTESYSYDSLQRLVSATRVFSNEPVPDTTVNYAYDAAGNLLQKSDYATALYYGTSNGGAANSNAGPHAVSRAVLLDGSTRTYNYDAAGQRISGNGVTLSYTASGKPKRISTASGVVEFFYAANGERYKKVSTTGGSTRTTHYVDGDVEVELTSTGTVTRTDIAGVALVRRSETANTSSHSLRYVLRDRLGSVVTLTDALNQVQEHRSFDAFGKPRYGGMVEGNGTLTSLTQGASFTPRGFTGHEHIDSAKLIHMNGRGYDYQLGRFLSVDPFIQAPANSQSHNPYSYIMNNPLAGTDPSGYLWCGTGSLGKAECNDERKHKRRDSGSVGFRAVETIWINGGPAASNGARHSPRSAATGEKERGAIGGPGEGGSIRALKLGSDDKNFFVDSDRKKLDDALAKVNELRKSLDPFETEKEAAIWLNDNAGNLQDQYGAEVGAIISKVFGENTGWKIGMVVTSYHSNYVDLASSKVVAGKRDYIDTSISGRSDWHTHSSGSFYASWGRYRDSHKSYYRAYVSSVGRSGKPSLSLYDAPAVRKGTWPPTRSTFDNANFCLKGECR
ncbi:FG-GAP-like repeat-containing protein [Pseudidiomarina sp.]|uniref:FG-GAP-like repeat-containing protein n=1 Tax=Pseudidiomarina sp. TaxID=2081707 RepID=UPI003A979277